MANVNNADRLIKEYLTIKFNFIDFFYAYCEAKGFDDPENNPEMTDELYTQFEEECAKKINYKLVCNLRDVITQEANERIHELMS